MDRIEEISIDMYKPYKSLAMEVLPSAEIVADRFHVMGQINDELDRERRKIRRLKIKLRKKRLNQQWFTVNTHYYEMLKS